MENLRSAQNTLEHTKRMFRKGYVSPLQREAQEFAVKRAELELASAQKAKEVLEQFTKAKTLEDLNSQVATAQAKMTGLKPKVYKPNRKAHITYNALFKLYCQLHDAFGTTGYNDSLANVMKDLLALRDEARGIGK